MFFRASIRNTRGNGLLGLPGEALEMPLTFVPRRRDGEPAIPVICLFQSYAQSLSHGRYNIRQSLGPPDLEIVELEEQRARLKQRKYRTEGHKQEEQIRKLASQIRMKRANCDKQAVKEYCEDYFYYRLTWDIIHG
ncbi:hypothetical protein FOFC_07546 [Fusarium oxysporum]|nr:hypothetical protein FOFC_07546 [Fusarium oxysporum]